jgi:hypothetical protein
MGPVTASKTEGFASQTGSTGPVAASEAEGFAS